MNVVLQWTNPSCPYAQALRQRQHAGHAEGSRGQGRRLAVHQLHREAVNYVRQGLSEALAGKPLSAAVTRPYGCSVKYES